MTTSEHEYEIQRFYYHPYGDLKSPYMIQASCKTHAWRWTQTDDTGLLEAAFIEAIVAHEHT